MAASPAEVAQKWASEWSQDDASRWVALYTPDAVYTDFAYLFRRTGHASLTIHHNLWRTSNPDFTMRLAAEWTPTNLKSKTTDVDQETTEYSIRFLGTGTFLYDLPILKANGRKYTFQGRVDFVMKRAEDGLWRIEKLNEWYNPNFADASEDDIKLVPEGS